MLEIFADRNMVAHVMFFVGNKNVRWPEERSAADEIYWRYAMARLSAHPSVVLDVSKEAGSSNSKRSVAYFVERMRLMRSMNAHGRLLAAHSGFDWTNRCDEAPELCDIMSAQVHFPHRGDDAIRSIHDEYYPYLARAAASATAPWVNVEFFYQWGPVDGCHFACCGSCTNVSGSRDPRGNANLMRKVMWENYMAGVTGACWYHDDLGWDILDPRALTVTAGEMRTLRTLRDFWDSVPRREFAVAPAEACVANVQPAGSAIHCLVRRNGSTDDSPLAAMILHVRRDTSARPRFEVVTRAPVRPGVFEGDGKAPLATLQRAAAGPSGFWLDPSSTDGRKVALTAAAGAAGTGVFEQPRSFAHDAILHLTF